MTTEARKDPRKNFVPRYLPWLLALAMLGVYGATLNPWVSRLNLDYVARVSGWTWQPDLYKPLAWLATGLLRWLDSPGLEFLLRRVRGRDPRFPRPLGGVAAPGPHGTAASAGKV